jgi:hypothetical protein
MMVQHLAATATKPAADTAAAPLPPRSELRHPLNWPASASKAKPVLRSLGAKRVREVGAPSAEQRALLAGLPLSAGEARANVLLVHARTGWGFGCGYILWERKPTAADEACEPAYLGEPHWWNVTERGLWVDATPLAEPGGEPGGGACGGAGSGAEAAATADREPLVFVESAQTAAPLPPYAGPSGGPAADPMVVWAVEGLSNRLRTVLSHRVVAHAAGRPLLVLWRRDELCNGYFLDCFAALPGVRFVKEPPPGSRPEPMSECHPSLKNTLREAYAYAALGPNESVRAEVAERLKGCGRPFAAVHIRRTDHLTAIRPEQQTKDEAFLAFCERGGRPSHEPPRPVYIATDNATTQAEFTARLGPRARHAKQIRPSGSMRQTALRDAAVDMLVCAASDAFMGSHGSSFSDAIAHLRLATGRSSADDEHVLMN